jgi:hypothetical protein
MKNLVALALCSALSAHAVEITTTGYGATVGDATRNARQQAVDEVAGSFVTSTDTAIDGTYTSRINQYSGGVIRKMKVLNVSQNGDLVEVTIRADIDDEKVNRLFMPNGTVPAELSEDLAVAQEKNNRARDMIRTFNDLSQAFAVRGKITKYANRGDVTDITIIVGMAWSPKWFDDVRKFAQLAGRETVTKNGTSNAFRVLNTVSMPFSAGLSTLAGAAARHTDNAPVASSVYSYCFSETRSHDVDGCFEIGYDMPKITYRDRWNVTMKLMSNGRVVKTLPLVVINNDQLFATVKSGTHLYFDNSATERKFTNPGVVLFRKGIAGNEYTHTVNTDILRSVDGVEYELQQH